MGLKVQFSRMHKWRLVFHITEIIKLVALVLFPVLGGHTECEADPINLLPWLLVAGLSPIAMYILYPLGILVASPLICFFYKDCSGRFDADACNDFTSCKAIFHWSSGFFATNLAMDMFHAIWFLIGVYVLTTLSECQDFGIALFGVIYLAVLVARSLAVSIWMVTDCSCCACC
jgi:hypothetical protein